MPLLPRTQLLRRLPHPHARRKDSPKTQSGGLHPVSRHRSQLRQRQRLHPKGQTLGLPDSLLHGRLGILLSFRKNLHPSIPRLPQHPFPGVGRDPARVPHLPPSLSALRRPPTYVHTQRPYGLLCGQFLNHSSLPLLQRQRTPPTKSLLHHSSKGPGHRPVLLGPQNQTYPLANPEPEDTSLTCPHRTGQPPLPTLPSGQMAGVLVHALLQHGPPL